MLTAVLTSLMVSAPAPTPAPPLDTNRTLEVLPADPMRAFSAAAQRLGDRSILLAEATVNAEVLQRLARPPKGEPMLRWVRETLGRPVVVEDFVYFLDDLVSAPSLPESMSVPASRARAYGILLHPQDIFKKKPRSYGGYGELPLDNPPSQVDLQPAPDGALPGPMWTARYQQPMTDEGKIEELIEQNPRFGRAVESLFSQLKKQGAFTWVEAGVRPRERGFLIYGSWYVSRSPSPKALAARITTLDGYEKAWGLDIPITWRHPDGFKATVEAARAMADTYGVDYATPRGAQRSSHYGGKAVDIVAVDLPRTLHLRAPDGAARTFDLSAPDSARDVSLIPEVVDWVEAHFGMRKLRRDYPHWSDRRR